MTNLKTTIKALSIATAVSFSMNAMSAPVNVPGLPTGYTFTNSGQDTTAGFDAIGGMNSIVDSLALTGAPQMNQDNFWSAFIGDPNSPESFFDYAAAKPMIEELVYTVEGKSFHDQTDGEITITKNGSELTFTQSEEGGEWTQVGGNNVLSDSQVQSGVIPGNYDSVATFNETFETAGYHDATDRGDDAAWTTKSSVSGNAGFVINAHIKESGANGRNVLENLDIISSETDDRFGTDNSAMSFNSRTDAQLRSSALTNNAAIDILANATDGTARVNTAGYVNAVSLLEKIALQNVEKNVLDVDAATAALDALIDHHNGFLSASLNKQANELKAILQNSAYLTTASILGQSSASVCEDQATTGIIDPVCSAHGQAFKVIDDKIDTTAIVGDYNSALTALNGFVKDIVAFDAAGANTFNPTGSASAINGEYGVIAVEGVAQGSVTDWSDSLAVDFDLFDASVTVDGIEIEFE